MNKVKNLTGIKFNRLLVIKRFEGKCLQKRAYWICQCDCGGEKICISSNLIRGTTQSCGCLRKESAIKHFKEIGVKSVIDLTGKTFGRLKVIERADTTKDRQIRWKCLCDCGIEKLVRGAELRKNKTQSCGCLNREINSKRMIGNTQSITIHGLSNHPLRAIRKAMIHRCYNKNNPFYKNYGGRGIEVCEEWKNSLQSFYDWSINNGWIKGLSIDRKDNNADYCPENCHWITISENSRKNCILGKEVGKGRKKKNNITL